MFSLARKLLNNPAGLGHCPQLVFPGELANQSADPWMKRIIALANGQSAKEIAQALYLEELRAGAEMADLGLWRNLFFAQVDQTLKEMSEQGYVRLVSRDLDSTDNKLRVT